MGVFIELLSDDDREMGFIILCVWRHELVVTHLISSPLPSYNNWGRYDLEDIFTKYFEWSFGGVEIPFVKSQANNSNSAVKFNTIIPSV